MKAIILNAGKGSRLAPFTDDNHKCLIDIGERKIIDFQLDALRQAGITDIVIVVGHLKEKIKEYVKKYSDLNFVFIENDAYQTTNTAYSLLLAKKEMNDEFIYLNGDVLFDPEMLMRLIHSKHKNALAVEKKKCGEEEVKVTLVKKRITAISKKVSVSKAYGEFVGIAKFSKDIFSDFKKALEETIVKEKLLKEYFEYALDKITKKVTLTAVDISDLKTIEVDFPADLEKARKLFGESVSIEAKKKILFYVERDLHLPFLEPIHDYLKKNYKYELAFSAPEFVVPKDGQVGIGLREKEISRLRQKSNFFEDPEVFKPDITVVADVSFSLKNCGKIVNVGHGIISKGGFYRDAPIVRRENLADLICVPGEWHKEILKKNVFVPIVATGFIKSDKMFGPGAVKRSDFCTANKIDETKKIILYAPTFNPELSSIPIIQDKIKDLVDENAILLIKLHSMTDIVYVNMYKELSRNNRKILFIDDLDLTPSMMAADVMISDVSSAAVEFLFLNKPVIVFNNPRTSEYAYYDPEDIEYKVRDACKVVSSFEELKFALKLSLNNPHEFEEKRKHYAEMLCFGRDGKAAQRAAEAIDDLINDKVLDDIQQKGITVFLLSNAERTCDEIEMIVNSLYLTNPSAGLFVYVFANYKPGYNIAKLKITKWISWENSSDISAIITELKTEHVIITRDVYTRPYRWIEKLENYFKWYPQAEGVNALNDRDDYNELLQKYFTHIKSDDFENIEHNFRHFIGADVSVQSINGICFVVKTKVLKGANNFTNISNNESFIKSIAEILTNKNTQIKQALDLFIYTDKNYLQAKPKEIPVESELHGIKDQLIKNIEGNTWDIESRLKLYQIQCIGVETELNSTNELQTPVNVEPEVSIVLITYNQLKYTKECVESIIIYTTTNYEIIFVDNASQDSTLEWIGELCDGNKNFRFIANSANVGFTKAANQGIIESRGRYVLLLNNDTVVTKNWVEKMIEIADDDEKIGIVGPISNDVSGFQIDRNAVYKDVRGMLNYANKVQKQNKGEIVQFPRVAFLCTLIKREVLEKIGGLDERFSPGNFEDDDFCLRAQIAGYKTVIAKDVFIHHYGSKSFKADGNEKYAARLNENQKIFVDKWGANPDEIWLAGKQIKNRNISYPINMETFSSSIDRFVIHVEEKDFNLANIEIRKAVESFKTAKDKRGYEFNVLLNLAGNISMILGDFQNAQIYFEQELELVPSSSSACLGLAQVMYALQQYEGSKLMFEWAVKNDLSNIKAIDGLAQVNKLLGLEEAHNSLIEK
ncbi:MAG: glycosyltransferase [bacterium]